MQWSEQLNNALILNGIYGHVFDTITPCPSLNLKPCVHANWGLNNQLAITFIKLDFDDSEHCDLVTDRGVAQ